MSLTTKELQARSRAFYAQPLSVPADRMLPYAMAQWHANGVIRPTLTHKQTFILPRHPFRAPTLPEGLSPLAADLFSVARPLVRPSDVRSLYESIECAPHVGQNIRAQA